MTTQPGTAAATEDHAAPGDRDDAVVVGRGDAPTDTLTPGRVAGWFGYTLPGAWVALMFVCLSFTPSLLPRPAFWHRCRTGRRRTADHGNPGSRDLGADYHTSRIDAERRTRNHVRQLEALGYNVTLTAAA